MAAKTIWNLIRQTFSDYVEDNVPRLAAALAYYTIFAIAPLLIIAVAIVGFVFGERAAQGELQVQLERLMGSGGAETVQNLVKNANQRGGGILATVIGGVTLLIGATGVFGELQSAMNTIWDVKAKPAGVWGVVRQRLGSFLMVLGIAGLLFASMLVSAAIAALTKVTGWAAVAGWADLGVSLGVITLLFAMIYKFLPDVKIKWGDVWIGALITAALFIVGKYGIGWYLGRGSVTSVFGGAGSLVAVLVWIFYSAQILFIGAEFTQAYARWRGERIVPDEAAEWRPEHFASAAEGAPRHPETLPPAPLQAPKTLPVATNGHTTGGRIAPLLVGLMIGRLLLGGKKRKGRAGRSVALGRVLESGRAVH